MKQKIKTAAELREAEAGLTGAADWLSMWSTIVVPLTILALGLLAYNNSDSTRAWKYAKYVKDSTAAATDIRERDSTAAWEAHFYDSLGKARAAAGWCDIGHESCSER